MNRGSFKQERYRYAVIAVYILAAVVNSLPANTFSSINSTVERIFQISIIEVSINSIIFPIAHVLFSFPCNLLINKKGVKVSFILAALFMIVGMWLRTFLAIGNPYICILGSFLTAIGGIFVLNTPSRIALYWFKSQLVPYVTFLGMLINVISMAFGLTLPGFFISSTSSTDEIIQFLRLQAIIVTIPFILLAIFIKQKPSSPPSRAAQLIDQQKKDYKLIMKALFSNKQYIKLSLVMAFNFGVCIAFFAVLEQTLTSLGYSNSPKIISTLGTSGTIFGIIGNILYSYILKKTKRYRLILFISSSLYLIGFCILILGFMQMVETLFLIALITVIFCMSYFSLPSICILFSTQLAFPIDQASAAGYMLAFSQTIGFLFGLLFTSMLNGSSQRSEYIFLIVACCIFASALLSFFVKQNLYKTNYEKSLLQNASVITESEHQ